MTNHQHHDTPTTSSSTMTSKNNTIQIASDEQYHALVANQQHTKSAQSQSLTSAVYFYAQWAHECKDMSIVESLISKLIYNNYLLFL